MKTLRSMSGKSDKIIGIIPARIGSGRLPRKPLADICGISMITRVCLRASQAVDELFVATDSPEIISEVESNGFRAILTSSDCPNGTARVAEAAARLGLTDSVIVDIQGDEPLIEPLYINKVVNRLTSTSSADISTLVCRFDPSEGFPALADPNRVKVVTDSSGFALYFSRSVIPFIKDQPTSQWPDDYPFLIHSGIYAFRPGLLSELPTIPASPLEKSESLEQLRWIHHGLRIICAFASSRSIPVDTEADLISVRRIVSSQSPSKTPDRPEANR